MQVGRNRVSGLTPNLGFQTLIRVVLRRSSRRGDENVERRLDVMGLESKEFQAFRDDLNRKYIET